MSEPVVFQSANADEIARVGANGKLVHINWPAIERVAECNAVGSPVAKLLLAVRDSVRDGAGE